MRAFDRYDLWFGIVLAAFFVPVAIMVLGAAVTEPRFWLMLLAWAGFVIVMTLFQMLIDRSRRALGLVLYFCLGFTLVALDDLWKGHALSLLAAVGVGLFFVIVDVFARYFRSRREAEYV